MRKQLLRDKQGIGLEDIRGIVFILIVLGMLFGVGLYVLGELRYKVAVSESYTNVNESIATVINGTGVEINNASLRDCAISSAICVNASSTGAEGIIPTANYTTTGCRITLLDSEANNNTLWNCTTTVSYRIDKSASSGIMNATLATNDLAAWLPIIVVILVASIIILIVVRKFGSEVS